MKRPARNISSKGNCYYAVHHTRRKNMNLAGVRKVNTVGTKRL